MADRTIPGSRMAGPGDYIDGVIEQWTTIHPEVSIASAAVLGRVRRLAQIVQLRGDAVLSAHGITRSEFDLLAVLARRGPLTPTELASELLISGAGTTKRIKKLASANLVHREANPDDGRGALIRMTPAGRDIILPVLSSVSQFEEELLTGLGADQRDLLAVHLRTLLLSLEQA